jgi:hypothetical protein
MLRKLSIQILKKKFSTKKQSNFHFNYDDIHDKNEDELILEIPKTKTRNNLSFKLN